MTSPHPEYPKPENHVEPCPNCGLMPDLTGMPAGGYRYVQLTDGRVALQLHVPVDPALATETILAHVCEPPSVVAEAEAITKAAAE